jgi:hypothetical protein
MFVKHVESSGDEHRPSHLLRISVALYGRPEANMAYTLGAACRAAPGRQLLLRITTVTSECVVAGGVVGVGVEVVVASAANQYVDGVVVSARIAND